MAKTIKELKDKLREKQFNSLLDNSVDEQLDIKHMICKAYPCCDTWPGGCGYPEDISKMLIPYDTNPPDY